MCLHALLTLVKHSIVSYWKLFYKLLEDNIPISVVSLLAFWYSHQSLCVSLCVSWHSTTSDIFSVSNGTRQGSILSPLIFTHYIHGVLQGIVKSHFGCNIGGVFVNILAYADDMVLLAPSWAGLQHLINIF
jgi:Reverse transcriptase (RNA-dependent DNA polymerase)